MGWFFILLLLLIPSFFLASASDPSLVNPDDINLSYLNLGSKSSNGINPAYDFLPPCETVGDVDVGTSPTLVIPNLHVSADILGETIDGVEASTASSSSTRDPAILSSYGSSQPSGTTYNDVEASTTSTSSVQTLAIPDPFASVHNLLPAVDEVDASRVSTSSIRPCETIGDVDASTSPTLVNPNQHVIVDIPDETIDDAEANTASSSSTHEPFARLHNLLRAADDVDGSRDGPFNLGQTNIGLTFQAGLALMLFHLQGSFSANTRSISFNLMGVSMIIGFTFSVIGIFLRKERPELATLGSYISLFSTAFGFFMMIEMFLPGSFSWTVWPAFVFVFLAFVFALARTG